VPHCICQHCQLGTGCPIASKIHRESKHLKRRCKGEVMERRHEVNNRIGREKVFAAGESPSASQS